MMTVPQYGVEVECAPGLEALVFDEVARCFPEGLPGDRRSIEIAPGAIQFTFTGKLEKLRALKTATAAYLVVHFDIPRPRALLGDQNFRRLLEGIHLVLEMGDQQRYKTLFISAAGRDSRILTRLKHALAEATGLRAGSHEGDLLLRLRRPRSKRPGWEVLVRLTPRPLATRDWRVCNYEGALNASVAQAMIQLTQPRPGDIYLNLACGSGTLLVERQEWGLCQLAIGCDNSTVALSCARSNLIAARLLDRVSLISADGGALPLASGSVDVVCADLPFGGLVGTHVENIELYPRLLRECARVTRTGGRVALITHEIKLIRSLISLSDDWRVLREIQITLSGLHPCISLLSRVQE